MFEKYITYNESVCCLQTKPCTKGNNELVSKIMSMAITQLRELIIENPEGHRLTKRDCTLILF